MVTDLSFVQGTRIFKKSRGEDHDKEHSRDSIHWAQDMKVLEKQVSHQKTCNIEEALTNQVDIKEWHS